MYIYHHVFSISAMLSFQERGHICKRQEVEGKYPLLSVDMICI